MHTPRRTHAPSAAPDARFLRRCCALFGFDLDHLLTAPQPCCASLSLTHPLPAHFTSAPLCSPQSAAATLCSCSHRTPRLLSSARSAHSGRRHAAHATLPTLTRAACCEGLRLAHVWSKRTVARLLTFLGLRLAERRTRWEREVKGWSGGAQQGSKERVGAREAGEQQSGSGGGPGAAAGRCSRQGGGVGQGGSVHARWRCRRGRCARASCVVRDGCDVHGRAELCRRLLRASGGHRLLAAAIHGAGGHRGCRLG